MEGPIVTTGMQNNKKSTEIMTVYSADFSSDFTFIYGEERD